MSNQIKTGHYEADDGIVNLPIGFIPDVLDMDEVGTTNPDHIRWYRRQEQDEASGSQEGMITNGADGVITKLADAGGITAYNTGAQSPASGTGAGQLAQWVASTSYTARTAAAPGSYVKPTVSSPTDRGAVFECVTGGTSGSAEPTWPDAIDETVLDSSPVWKRIDLSLQRGGYQGIVIAAALNTNGQEWYYEAKQADQSVDHGDTAGWTDGIDPDA